MDHKVYMASQLEARGGFSPLPDVLLRQPRGPRSTHPVDMLVETILDTDLSNPEERPLCTTEFIPTKIAMEALGKIYVPRINVGGEENLLEARKQISEGKRLVLVPNHLSNIDEITAEMAMMRKGFSDIRDNLVYLQGIRLDRKLLTKFFLGAFKRIRVWPPTEKPTTEEEKSTFKTLTKESKVSAKDVLSKGHHLVIFAEGGRSYSGQMKEGVTATAHYLLLEPDTVVLPISISGTEKILPVENTLPPIKNIFQHHIPSVYFGELIPVDSLLQKYGDLRNSERNQNMVNDIMQNVAIHLPEQYRGVYK